MQGLQSPVAFSPCVIVTAPYQEICILQSTVPYSTGGFLMLALQAQRQGKKNACGWESLWGVPSNFSMSRLLPLPADVAEGVLGHLGP